MKCGALVHRDWGNYLEEEKKQKEREREREKSLSIGDKSISYPLKNRDRDVALITEMLRRNLTACMQVKLR